MRQLILALTALLIGSVSVGVSTPAEAGWRKINHRDTMHCFPRGSVPTGKVIVRTCGGVKYKVVGGSLSTGAHRQAWKWVSGGRWRQINHRDTMHCFPRGSVPTGKVRVRTCGGVKYKVVGGSLSTGAHRQAWQWSEY